MKNFIITKLEGSHTFTKYTLTDNIIVNIFFKVGRFTKQ